MLGNKKTREEYSMDQQKNQYQIKIELKSDAIFTNGEKQRNIVQSRALTDEDGFVYLHAKSLKGHLKKQAFWLLHKYDSVYQNTKEISEANKSHIKQRRDQFLSSIEVLFGLNDWEKQLFIPVDMNVKKHPTQGLIKLGHLQLPQRVRQYFSQLLNEEVSAQYVQLNKQELLEAQSNIRTYIQLDETGVVKDNQLASFHTVKRGLVFFADINIQPDPLNKFYNANDFNTYLDDLSLIVKSMRVIGAGVHRGTGNIQAELLLNGRSYCSPSLGSKQGEMTT